MHLPVFCYTKRSVLRICQNVLSLFNSLRCYWIECSAWKCVGERRWVQSWHVAWLPTVPKPITPRFFLIRLIKCFVGTGPVRHSINTPSSATPTPPLHPFIFHMFPFRVFISFYYRIRDVLHFPSLSAKRCVYLKGVEKSHEYCFCFSWTNQCLLYALHSLANVYIFCARTMDNNFIV